MCKKLENNIDDPPKHFVSSCFRWMGSILNSLPAHLRNWFKLTLILDNYVKVTTHDQQILFLRKSIKYLTNSGKQRGGAVVKVRLEKRENRKSQ